jgi:hypothetical protein
VVGRAYCSTRPELQAINVGLTFNDPRPAACMLILSKRFLRRALPQIGIDMYWPPIITTAGAAIAECRAVQQAYPCLGDDAEKLLPNRLSYGPGSAPRRSRQAAAFDHASRRNGAQRFDEIVDVRIERRKMPPPRVAIQPPRVELGNGAA